MQHNLPSHAPCISAHYVKGIGGVPDPKQAIAAPLTLRPNLSLIIPGPEGSPF